MKKSGGKLITTTKTEEYGLFINTCKMVGWKDERTKGGRRIFIFFFFLGVERIKHGVVDDIHLHLLAHKLENYWKRLGRRLRFNDAELVVFDRSNDNLIEKALVMLLKWKSREGLKSSYQALHDALCHPLVNRRDLAFEICIDASPFLVST